MPLVNKEIKEDKMSVVGAAWFGFFKMSLFQASSVAL